MHSDSNLLFAFVRIACVVYIVNGVCGIIIYKTQLQMNKLNQCVQKMLNVYVCM